VPDSGDDRGQREGRFRALYQEQYGPIQAYAVRRTASPEDAADVVADTFMIAWRRLDDVPEPPADRWWLYGVARRVVAGRHRSARRSSGLLALLTRVAAGPGWEPAGTSPPSLSDQVLDAIARLRPADREALRLVIWEQLSHAEAAQVLGCSVNAVAIRVHRAKRRLRTVLRPANQVHQTQRLNGR
jgi:RNA polymerase sigma-70 factor, ECF subfamily